MRLEIIESPSRDATLRRFMLGQLIVWNLCCRGCEEGEGKSKSWRRFGFRRTVLARYKERAYHKLLYRFLSHWIDLCSTLTS